MTKTRDVTHSQEVAVTKIVIVVLTCATIIYLALGSDAGRGPEFFRCLRITIAGIVGAGAIRIIDRGEG